MPDIFSRSVSYGGAFSADGAAVTFGVTTGGTNFNAGFLVQSIRWAYQQAITRLYEIGSSSVYLVAGRTAGQLQMSRVLGPTVIQSAFYTQFGNVCNASANNLTITARTGCGTTSAGTTQKFYINHAVLQKIEGGIDNPELMTMVEAMDLLFLYMSLETTQPSST
jgi:hypothetical protein